MPSHYSAHRALLRTGLVLVLITAASVLTGRTASANIGEAFGFGARSSALGGADIAGGFDGFASYANPGALPFSGDKRMILSWSLIYVAPNFTPITNVITQNVLTGGSVTAPGSVNTNYLATFGQALGLTYRIFPDWDNFTFGLTAFLPISQVAYMDTGETYLPEYLLYRARTQRPQIDAGMGVDIGKGLQVGVGLHLGFALTSNATVNLTSTTNTSSSMRFIASLVPRAGPYFGLYYRPGNTDDLTLGAVFRMAVASPNTLTLSAAAAVLGGLGNLPFNFSANGSIYYDPMMLELGGTIASFWHSKFFAQLDYEVWSAFQAPGLAITNPTIGGVNPGGLTLVPTSVPSYTYTDILVPRIGQEIELGEITSLRWGYSFHQSIISSALSGNGNYIDPPKHSINLGVGWKFRHFLGFETPSTLDLYATYDVLVSQTVTKPTGSAADAAGDTGAQLIGAPGYTTGGNMIGGGMSVTLPF